MTWEARGRRIYYYRKQRHGRRVVSEYVGKGAAAQLRSRADRAEQERRRLDRVSCKQRTAEYKDLDARVEFLSSSIGAFVCAALLKSGFHRHKGQWRKTRNG
jgi:hypothetical protein